MAKLLMIDGTVRNVDYNKAAKILEILNGLKEPDDDKQAEFVLKVKDVDFGDNHRVTHASPRRTSIEHDEEIDKIIANPKLKGVEKARAVARRIKERVG